MAKTVTLRLVRKRAISDPVRMVPGQTVDFPAERAKELLGAHPGWFAEVKRSEPGDGGTGGGGKDPAPLSRTKPEAPRTK
jgi:hypothetical protein